MPARLVVEHDGRRIECDGSQPVTIGRDPSNTVRCDHPAVSRFHVRVELVGGAWIATDLSSLGTFVGNERIRERRVEGPVAFRLGDPVSGESVRLVVEDPFARPAPVEFGTVLVPKDLDGAVDRLVVEVGGNEVVASSGQTLRVGRDKTCDVVVDDPIVSRRHARISQRGTRWTIEDDGSSGGTFVNKRRVDQADLDDGTVVNLGAADGPAIRIRVGTAHRGDGPGRRKLAYILGAVALVAVVVGAAVAIAWPDGPAPVEDPLALPKRATVLLEALPDGGSGSTIGSGTIVSSNGLILTAASVVARDAPGLAPSYPSGSDKATREASRPASRVDVYMYESDDRVEKRYRASVVVADGYLDLAVLQIDRTANGGALDPETLDLDHIELGNTDAIRVGDEMTALSYAGGTAGGSLDGAKELVTRFSTDSMFDDPRALIAGERTQLSVGALGGGLIGPEGELDGIAVDRRGISPSVLYRPPHLASELVEAASSGSPDRYEGERYVQAADLNASFQLQGVSTDTSCASASKSVRRDQGVRHVLLNFRNVAPGQAVYVEVSAEGSDEPLGSGWRLWRKQQTEDVNYVLPKDGCRAWVVNIPPSMLAPLTAKSLTVKVFQGPSFDSFSSVPQAQFSLPIEAPPAPGD